MTTGTTEKRDVIGDEFRRRAQAARDDRAIAAGWQATAAVAVISALLGLALGGSSLPAGLIVGVLLLGLSFGIRAKVATASLLVIALVVIDMVVSLAAGLPPFGVVKLLLIWFAGRAFRASLRTTGA